MCANDPYTSSCKRKAPLLSVCLCFTPLEAERCASVASSPSLWPGGAPLSPGRSVFMPLASSNPPRQCMEPAPTQRQSGRAAEPPPEPSPGHVPRCERAISPTYAAKPGLTCTATCRFLCRTASDQARRASGRWPKGASEPPASFRGTGRPNLCAAKTPVWQSRPDLAVRSEAATKRELGLRLADPREGASGAIEGRRRLPNRRFCSTSYGEAVRQGIAEPSEGRLGRESTPMTISKRLQRAARPRQPA